MALNTMGWSVAVIVAVLFGTPSMAATLQGSFAGIATGSRYDALSPDGTDFDGEAITGTFAIDLSRPPVYSVPNADGLYAIYSPGVVGLTFNAHGRTAVFGTGGQTSGLTLGTTGGLQQLYATADLTNPYHYATIQLTGPLFTGLDPTSLHVADIDLSRSGLSFFDSRSFGSGVTLTSLTFASTVPEPTTSALMSLGLLGVAYRSRHRYSLRTLRPS